MCHDKRKSVEKIAATSLQMHVGRGAVGDIGIVISARKRGDRYSTEKITRVLTLAKLNAAPLGGQRQESDAAEEVTEEAVLLHAHQTGRWGSTQLAPCCNRDIHND